MIHKEAVRVSVGGKSYTLISDEDHSHIYEAAALVDKMLHDNTSNSLRDEQKAMVLVAFQLASLLIKQQNMTQQQRENSEVILRWIKSQDDYLSTFLVYNGA